MIVAVTAGSAAAATYDKSYGPSPRGGYGRTSGSLDFHNRTSFGFNTWLDDVCPGDYLGVSFYFNITHGDGSTHQTEVKGANQRGCDLQTYHYGNVYRDKRVARTQVISCWTDGGNLCWAVPVDGITEWKYNPY